MRTVEQLRDIAKRVRECGTLKAEREIATDGTVVLESVWADLFRRDDCKYHVRATHWYRSTGCSYKSIDTEILADALEELDTWAGVEIDL